MNGVSLCANETLEATLDQYGDMILRLAFSCLKNREDAEDVLQDVFVKLIEHHPRFESGEHEKAWLIRVTINICRNRLRSPWRRHKELDEAISETAFVEQWDSVLEDESGVMTAVMQLPQKYQEVIHLFYYEDCSISQIAAILRKKESTVRSLLHRARAMLKDSLKEGWNFE